METLVTGGTAVEELDDFWGIVSVLSWQLAENNKKSQI